jgi:hypothetical protein
MSEELYNYEHWKPNSDIVKYLEKCVPETKDAFILEMTSNPTEKVFSCSNRHISWYNIPKDLDNDTYEFVYMRHTLEKLQNPQDFLEFLRMYSTRGYIETTSPLVEMMKRIQNVELKHRGHLLNRYIIWTDPDTNILHILPKYSLFEYISVSEEFENNMRNMLQKHPHYWNNYYYWDSTNPIEYILYQHNVNFDLEKDYDNLITKAIQDSINFSNKFLSHINDNKDIFKDIYDTLSKSVEA